MSFGLKKKTKRLFKELPFYNTSIEKPYIKRLKNTYILRELFLMN